MLLDDVEAVIPRIGASVSFYGTAVVRQFEMMGVYSVNESVAISRSRDKLRALQLLTESTELRDRLAQQEAAGITEIVYQPAGPDIERELTAYMEAARG